MYMLVTVCTAVCGVDGCELYCIHCNIIPSSCLLFWLHVLATPMFVYSADSTDWFSLVCRNLSGWWRVKKAKLWHCGMGLNLVAFAFMTGHWLA